LVTLTGTGGCGKTRLALEVARRSLDHYSDGVWLVELAPLSDPSLVVPTVLGALGKPEVGGEAPIATLVSFLKSRELLVVLDNCEHLVEASARLCETVLRVCPKVRILATSREMLGLAGEVAWRIPSLPVPAAEGPYSVQALAAYAAIALFVERARAVRSDFRLSDGNAATLAEIVRRLDGIPLAIELAATRVRALSVEEILQRLDDRFRLLTGGSRTALRRQQTLRALIDWSYDLLAVEEQALLRRVSVFAGSFSLEVAESVCGEAGGPLPNSKSQIPTLPVLDLLFQLVGKSLIVAEEQEEGSRYHLLETIRQYASEKLVELAEAADLRERHRAYFLDLAERVAPHLTGRDQKVWFDRLERELDNFRTALDWSAAEPDVDQHLRLVGALGRFWVLSSRPREGWERLEFALRRADWTSPQARAVALAWAGHYARILDRRQEALRLASEAAPLARQTGNVESLCIALTTAFYVARALAESDPTPYLEEAITAARQAGNHFTLAVGLILLGEHVAWTGDRAAGRRKIEEGLRVAQGLETTYVLANGYFVLANLAVRDRDAAEAEKQLTALQQVEPRLGLRAPNWSFILMLQGDVAALHGDLARARQAYVAGLRRARASEDGPSRWITLGRWASCCLVSGDAREAGVVLGALDSFYERTEIRSATSREIYVDPTIAFAARQSLGEEVYAIAFAEGKRLTLDQAIDRALASTDAENSTSPSS
jgi:predicted ATPase